MQFRPSNQQKYSETIDEANISMEQLRSDKKKMDTNFDAKLDELGDRTQELKGEQKKLGNEVRYQNKKLNDIEDQTDKNYMNIRKNNAKLNKMLKKGSDCCLWFTIFVEAAILVLIILYA
mmetsp:Transcript_57221/g.79370  ORF Transcript_57221/g.79370 Transcript_57221/m.79370 type:complete len:120 (+) Transcript_57221:270-629(+)